MRGWGCGAFAQVLFDQLETCAVKKVAVCAQAMAEQTQLDSVNELDNSGNELDSSEGVVVVSEGECSPPAKRPKYYETGPKDGSGDRIKWVNSPGGLVPFVLNAETDVIHSGRSQMKVERVGAATALVQCLSGCDADCSEGSGCTCLCHLLRAYYVERQLQLL